MLIYIVDDNPDVCEFLAFLLSSDGHRVHVFEDPEQALSHMLEWSLQPDILITDYNMPKMNGYQLHRQVSRHAPQVKTIVISGRNDLRREIGDLHFLQKPFPPEHLVGLIETLKSGWRGNAASQCSHARLEGGRG